MNKIKLLFLALVTSIGTSLAQNDTTCATATPLTSYVSNGNVQNVGQEWYSFTA